MFDKKTFFQKIVPHAICAAILLLLTLTYFYPVLNGKELRQQDIVRSSSISKEVVEHREKYGEEALWTNSQFSGMPAFSISIKYPGNFIKHIGILTGLRLPSAMGLLYTILIGFYILLLTFKVDPWVALLGAVAFGFSTHFLILYEAGHNSKLRTISYMAPVLASIFYTLRGKTLLGGILTAITLSLCIGANHIQIIYYLSIMVVFIIYAELVLSENKEAVKNYLTQSPSFQFVSNYWHLALLVIAIIVIVNGWKYGVDAATTILFFTTIPLAILLLITTSIGALFIKKPKALKSLAIKLVTLLFAAVLAIGPNVSSLWSTYTYGKETIRGGKSELTETKAKTDGGLDLAYAMRWSYGPTETLTLI
ncbi:MAG: hypothetical protein HRT72_10555, partial [Flavobacteriales bacterium]|nr:hypothetical protein [Flavobacteriales bacterium]